MLAPMRGPRRQRRGGEPPDLVTAYTGLKHRLLLRRPMCRPPFCAAARTESSGTIEPPRPACTKATTSSSSSTCCTDSRLLGCWFHTAVNHFENTQSPSSYVIKGIVCKPARVGRRNGCREI